MRLIELEDTHWFPEVLREQQLGYIGWLVKFLDIYRPLNRNLPTWLKESNRHYVFDLCSGSGEPMISLTRSISENIDVTLSDKFPLHRSDRSSSLSYISNSIDVLALDFDTDKYYTMFNAYHHFDKDDQRDIVKRLTKKGAPFCFVEILTPNLLTILKVIFINTLGQFILAPFVKPFSITRLLFTYLLPINILTTTYDGVIPVLISKNNKQYQTLLSGLSSDGYEIDIASLSAPYFNQLTIIRGFPIYQS